MAINNPKDERSSEPTFTGLVRSVNVLAKKVTEMHKDHKLLRIDFEKSRCAMEDQGHGTTAFQEASIAERKVMREELAINTTAMRGLQHDVKEIIIDRKAVRAELNEAALTIRNDVLADKKEVRNELTTNTEITRSIEAKINTFRPEVFAAIVAEHENRAAVRAWINRCFSSGTRIVVTAAAIVAVIAGGSGFVSWLLSHIK